MEIKFACNRISWLDFVRTIAICFVVLVHCTEGVYYFHLDGIGKEDLIVKIFAFTLFTIGRLGVPLFFLLTGYLFLDRDWSDSENIAGFYRKNLLGLFITSEIWVVFYNFYFTYFYARAFDLRLLLENMLFLKDVEMRYMWQHTGFGHMWYIPVILGVYMFIPFIARAIYGVNYKLLIFVSFFVICLCFVIPTINVVLKAMHIRQISKALYMWFSGGSYGFYIILGFLCKKNIFKNIKYKFICGISIISLVIAVWLQIFSYSLGIRYNIWYDSLPLALLALCIFELASRYDRNEFANVFTILAKYSFGIFFLHAPIRILCLQYIQLQSRVLLLIVVCLICIMLSTAIIYIFKWTPWLRRLLFYIS